MTTVKDKVTGETTIIDGKTGEIVPASKTNVLSLRDLQLRHTAEMERALTEAQEFLTGAGIDVEVDPEKAERYIIAQTLSAKTPEEVLTGGEATGVKEVLGEPFRVTDFGWHQSDYDEGLPFYAAIRAVRPNTGENLILTCGSKRILAQLIQLGRLGALPRRVIFQQAARPTKAGYYPLFIVDDQKATADFPAVGVTAVREP